MTSFTLILNDMLKVNKNILVKFIKSKMTYSESELDSNFAINSISDFDSAFEFGASESASESLWCSGYRYCTTSFN